jgi:hypothetical protein
VLKSDRGVSLSAAAAAVTNTVRVKPPFCSQFLKRPGGELLALLKQVYIERSVFEVPDAEVMPMERSPGA